MRIAGSHTSRPPKEKQQGIAKTDEVVSLMIRERDKDLPCVVCKGFKKEYDNGHFQAREAMSTRFHPWNMNKECRGCNRQDYSGYGHEKSFEYGLAIDEKWGVGTAVFLYQLAKQIEPWTAYELEQLRSAARHSYLAYTTLYKELRPHHFPPAKPIAVAA
jgi:hypothetical protein